MSQKFKQSFATASQTRFSGAPMSEVEFSRMTANPTHLLTFNAGDIVPIYCAEVLPHDVFSIDLDFVIRQNTVLTPTMGQMEVDVFAFWVPNRVVNDSWKNVQGENSSGQWVAPEVSLVPLYRANGADVQVPVGSVADYYGFPTQRAIPAAVLSQCHDLKFRGYLDIFNVHFRDQNYQPEIPFSKLNIYEGFFESKGQLIRVGDGTSFVNLSTLSTTPTDGSSPSGAVAKAIYGDGSPSRSTGNPSGILPSFVTTFSALDKPLKANKLHDYFTSVLPSPQKGRDVIFSLASSAPVLTQATNNTKRSSIPLLFTRIDGTSTGSPRPLGVSSSTLWQGNIYADSAVVPTSSDGWLPEGPGSGQVVPSNLVADLTEASAISVADLRLGSAMQRVYEVLARGGSRYREFINSFFGLDTENPFCDCSQLIGHIRRNLDLYQTAQTSASESSNTPQGNLAAFGYTNNGGSLFTKTFLEHGYVHIMAVVRHRNVYTSFLSRDNFRLNMMDFYLPQLANISEQPVYTREINPFSSDPDGVFGFQEAWAEYRYEPDRCSGYMRTGISGSLALWNYADEFDSGLIIADAEWLKSNSAEVLDRSLAVTSETAPQFKAMFMFSVTKERPMPTYSVPGADLI